MKLLIVKTTKSKTVLGGYLSPLLSCFFVRSSSFDTSNNLTKLKELF
jgi:hypothetical protein